MILQKNLCNQATNKDKNMPATDFNKLSKELSGSSGFFGSFLLFIIIALVAILLFWANITELDNVTRGEGKIVSSLQNQLMLLLWSSCLH